VHESYLQGTHTYTTDAMHILLDHMPLGHVGGGMWPGDEAKTIQCTCMTLSEVWIDSGTLYMPLEPELE